MTLWRLLYVRSGREYAVAAELVARRWSAYVPSETVWRGPAHKRYPHKRPMLLAGYVFAELDTEAFAVARHLPDVLDCLRTGSGEDSYQRIDGLIRPFIEDVRDQERRGDFDHTKRKGEGLSVGQRVKIIKGMFKGHLATITSLAGKHKIAVDVVNMGPAVIAASKVEEAA